MTLKPLVVSLSLIAVSCTQSAHQRPVVPIVLPVTVDALTRIDAGARSVLEPKGFEVRLISAEGDAAKFTPALQTALSYKPPFLLVVGTQLSNSLLSDRFRSSRPPFVATAIFDPSALAFQGRALATPPRPIAMAIISDAVKEAGSRILSAVSAFLPNAKLVGILMNPSESNSVASANEVVLALKSKGINTVVGALSTPADLTPVTKSLLARGIDAIAIPHDKIAVAQAATVVQLACPVPGSGKCIPVLSLDEGTVERDGALVGISANYFALGVEAAQLAMQSASAGDWERRPVINLDDAAIVARHSTIAKFHVTPPDDTRLVIKWLD